jgi:hypothetical protein
LDLFMIWGWILAAIGLRITNRLSSGASWAVVIIIALIGVMFRVVSAFFSGNPSYSILKSEEGSGVLSLRTLLAYWLRPPRGPDPRSGNDGTGSAVTSFSVCRLGSDRQLE